jgi:hypothetical protein
MNLSEEEGEASRKWIFATLYCTIVLVLPSLCLVLILFSQLLLYKGYLTACMCLWVLAMFYVTVKFIESKLAFDSRMRVMVKIYFIAYLLLIFGNRFYSYRLAPNQNLVSFRMGIFFLCLGFFYFIYLTHDTLEESNASLLISKSLNIKFMVVRT